MAINKIFDRADVLSVVCSNPTTPASGDPVRFGQRVGVALTDELTDGTTTVQFRGVFDLSVKGINDSGNSAVAVGDALFYVDADTPKISKKSSGYFIGTALETVGSGSTATIQVALQDSPGSGTLGTGTVGSTNLASAAVTTVKIADAQVTAAKLTATMAKGYIPLPLGTARIISSNAIQNTTEGGVPDGNTAPSLARVNGATDKQERLIWAASSSVEVQFDSFVYPPDLDDAAAVEVHLLIGKDTNTDTAATVAVGYFEGVGDTNAGGDTAALATASVTEYTVTIAAGDVGAAPKAAAVTITPGTHTTDAIWLYGAWVEYSRV